MDPRLEQLLRLLDRHKIALGGLVAAVALGSMTGDFLKPRGLLEEPMAAQLMSSTAAAFEPVQVIEPFPVAAADRPWIAGTDANRPAELPRLSASYDEPAQTDVFDTPMPDTTPSVADHAVDAVADVAMADDPAA